MYKKETMNYDEYIKLLENFPYDEHKLSFYSKWFSYIPHHWNITELLEKKVKDLTDEEIARINCLKSDRIAVELIEEYKKNPNYELHLELHEMFNIPYKKYAEFKLTNEELQKCYEVYNTDNEELIKERLSYLSSKGALTHPELYEVQLLKNKLTLINKSNKGLK